MAVKYTGEGRWYMTGIPARDLTDDEIAKLGVSEKELISSGIYRKAKKTSKEDE